VSSRIRLHLDENVDPDIARALRHYGIDVSTTQSAGLRTQSDVVQLDFIRREGRVIMTHDTDFLHIASTTHDHPGIVYCSKTARSVGEIIRGLILIYEVLTLEEMRGQVEYL